MKILLLITALGFIHACSGDPYSVSVMFNQSSKSNSKLVYIPIFVSQNSSLDLDSSENLDLSTSSRDMQISVGGCTSRFTLSTTAVTLGVTGLYEHDTNCVVKLQSFTLGSTVYSVDASGAKDFKTWIPGDTATFVSLSSSTDLITVYVASQVTQSGVLPSDKVTYNFTDISNSTASQEAKVTVGVPLLVGGGAPNFTIKSARLLSTNLNGSVNMSFTMECGSSVTGNSNSNFACDGAVLQNQVDYIFIPDTFSQGALTVSQANTIFSVNTPTSVGTLIIPSGGSDLNNNVVPNGGFYTSNSSPLITGSSVIYPSNLNNLLIIRRVNSNGDTVAYKYFYVDLASVQN